MNESPTGQEHQVKIAVAPQYWEEPTRPNNWPCIVHPAGSVPVVGQ